MGFVNRFFLLIGTLVLFLVSAAVLTCSLGIVPERLWLNEIRFALRQQETVIASLVFLCVAFRLLACTFSRSGSRETTHGEFLAVTGSMGSVGVAMDAIRDLVNRTVGLIGGVRDTKSHITMQKAKDGAAISVSLRLIIGQEKNVAALSETVSARVREQLAQTLGLTDVPIYVKIVGITDAAPIRKHRVV